MAYCASISQNVRPHGKAFFRNQIFALAVVTTWNKSGVRSLGPLLPVLSFEVMPFVLISIFESVNAWSLLLGSSQRVFLCFLWTGRASLKRMIFEQILVTFHFLTKKKSKHTKSSAFPTAPMGRGLHRNFMRVLATSLFCCITWHVVEDSLNNTDLLFELDLGLVKVIRHQKELIVTKTKGKKNALEELLSTTLPMEFE